MALTEKQVEALRMAGAEIADAALAQESKAAPARADYACDAEGDVERALLAAAACGASMDGDAGWREVRRGYSDRIAEKHESACGCGAVTGKPCNVLVAYRDFVQVEYVPDYKRAAAFSVAKILSIAGSTPSMRRLALCHHACAAAAVDGNRSWVRYHP